MKRVLSAVLAVALTLGMTTSPQAQADDNFDDLGAIILGVGAILIGAAILSDQMPEDAQLGFHMRFNENGNSGYIHYDSQGYGRHGDYRGRQCRSYTTVYTDRCGNPIREERTVECLNRRGRWKKVDQDNYAIERRYSGGRPHFNLCHQQPIPVEPGPTWPQEPWMHDQPWTHDQGPPMDIFDPLAPGIVPMQPQPPAILPMNNSPGFVFSPGTN